MKVLDMSFNKINKLHKQHFTCLPYLIQMALDYNDITHIVESLFEVNEPLLCLVISIIAFVIMFTSVCGKSVLVILMNKK